MTLAAAFRDECDSLEAMIDQRLGSFFPSLLRAAMAVCLAVTRAERLPRDPP
jgi:hypothetical protein